MTTTTTKARIDRQALRAAWAAERTAAREARRHGNNEAEWKHLERAHILSQPMAVAHVRTHVAMLAAGMRRHDRTEVLGQLLRIARRRTGLVDRPLPGRQHRRRGRQRPPPDAHPR